jgi:CubicO group peptidase (beta-lactamase class C family)
VRTLLVVVALSVAAPARGWGASFEAEAVAARLSARLGALATAGVFSGEMLVARRGQPVHAQTFGQVPAGALYRIASVTKGFTAGAILLLVERGKLKLSDPVARFFPELPDGHLRKGGHEITIDHLLSHSGGLEMSLAHRNQDPSAIVTALRGARVVTVPGTQHRYSNEGYVVLGDIIRRTTGQSYEAFLRHDVLTPLGLNDTGIVADEQQRARLMPGQHGTVLGLRPARELFPEIDWDYFEWQGGAAGALFSSVTDLTRWLDALSAGQFLGPAGHRLLFQPVIEDYARGFAVATLDDGGGGPGHKVIWHNGGLSPHGFQAFVALLQEQSVSVAVVANVDHSALDLTAVMFDVLGGSGSEALHRDSGLRAQASVRALHLGPGLALLVGATLLLPVVRRRRPWPRQLMAASAVVAVGGMGLGFLAPRGSFLLGSALLLLLAGWFVASHRSGERWVRGEAALSVFVAATAGVLLGGVLALRLVLGR